MQPTTNGSWSPDNENTQPRPAVHRVPPASAPSADPFQEPAYREHVTGSLVVSPSEAPYFRPAYPPYQPPAQPQQRPQGYVPPQYPAYPAQPQQRPQGYTPPQYPAYPAQPQQRPQGYTPQYPTYQAYPEQYGYNGNVNYYAPYYAPYYGYPIPGYAYPWPQQPKRDGYLLGMSITSFVGSILIFLGGLVCVLLLLLIMVAPARTLPADQQFNGIVQFISFAIAGVGGGIFSFYHSFRSLFLKKPSMELKLPQFWVFFALYLVVIAIGVWQRNTNQEVTNTPFTIFLIGLAGLFPALTIIALGVRRIHFPRQASWPTSWRRFTLALVSGATLGIFLALIFELILTALAANQLGLGPFTLDNPNQTLPKDPRLIGLLFLTVSVIAPIVEESVKPLAVVIMIGRMRSVAESFVLGLASGIGFDLIETSGYISMGYKDWLNVALMRSTAGLLHGFGAAMVAVGWYYLTHPKESNRRFLLAIGCWSYAILQHAIWNGSFGLQLLPAPIGPYLDTGTITLGSLAIPSFDLIYLAESLLMLTFFLYMTKKLRGKTSLSYSGTKT